MDGRSTKDGSCVVIKRVFKNQNEVDMTSYLCSPGLRSDPRNHCIPLLASIKVPGSPNEVLLVMPLFQDHQIPPVETVGDFIDFTRQLLEVSC
jgi:hypothetical protein